MNINNSYDSFLDTISRKKKEVRVIVNTTPYGTKLFFLENGGGPIVEHEDESAGRAKFEILLKQWFALKNLSKLTELYSNYSQEGNNGASHKPASLNTYTPLYQYA